MSNSLLGGNSQQGQMNPQGFAALAQLLQGLKQGQSMPQAATSSGALGPTGKLVGQAMQNPNGLGAGIGQAFQNGLSNLGSQASQIGSMFSPSTAAAGAGATAGTAAPAAANSIASGAANAAGAAGTAGTAAGAAGGSGILSALLALL